MQSPYCIYSHPAGRATRMQWRSAIGCRACSTWWSPAYYSSTFPASGSTSSRPLLSRGPSPTKISCARTEVRWHIDGFTFVYDVCVRWFECPFPVMSGVPPNKANHIEELAVVVPQNVWDHLYGRYVDSPWLLLYSGLFPGWLNGSGFLLRYGGGPAVNHLYVCNTCQIEVEKLEKRRKSELDMFVRVSWPLIHRIVNEITKYIWYYGCH